MASQDDNTVKPTQDSTVVSSATVRPNPEMEAKPVYKKEEGITHPSPEFEVSPEVQDHVSVISDKPDIPSDVSSAGVTHAPADTYIISKMDGLNIELPLTDDQIGEGLAKENSSGFKWLATWCTKKLRQAHYHLKKIQGHFVRIKDLK